MRLSAEQWEQARAEYEVRGVSLGEIARRFCVSTPAVSKRAQKENWVQGKSLGLVERKVAAIKELAAVEQESLEQPLTFQTTLNQVVSERLKTEYTVHSFAQAVAMKGKMMVAEAESPSDLELLSRSVRNIMPAQDKTGTTVNVQNTAQAASTAALTPKQVVEELLAQGDD